MPGRRIGRITRIACWAAIGIATGLTMGLLWWVTRSHDRLSHELIPFAEIPPIATVDDAMERRITRFCGDCHALPKPSSFPRSAWNEEVQKGYEFYARSGRNDLDPPPMAQTVAYYYARAPELLSFSKPPVLDERLRSAFRREKLDWQLNQYILPAVSFLRWVPLEPQGEPTLLVSDMRDGTVSAVSLEGPSRQRSVLVTLDHPSRVEPCDLDADGLTDLVVAELGSLYPADHDRGRVVWLRCRQAGVTYDANVIAEGLGRVADVRPGDVDKDGDTDLIVAEFGHYRTGNILLLRNESTSGEQLRFTTEQIDPRPGTIHVPLCDLNGDNRLDFIALISQEMESVDAFLNQGDGQFLLHNLWSAPDLTFGSSGIELTDLDQDGDTDILYTNGDSFDNSFANPSHGVQWLENTGGLTFEYHRLVDLPGAYRALSADFDSDGDQDVVAVSFLSPSVRPANLRAQDQASVLLLEQVSRGEFVPRALEVGLPVHATCEIGDFDSDGDIDFVVGSFLFPHGARDRQLSDAPRLIFWWNERVASGTR